MASIIATGLFQIALNAPSNKREKIIDAVLGGGKDKDILKVLEMAEINNLPSFGQMAVEKVIEHIHAPNKQSPALQSNYSNLSR